VSFTQEVTISLDELAKLKSELDTKSQIINQKKIMIEELSDSLSFYKSANITQILSQNNFINEIDSLKSILDEKNNTIQSFEKEIISYKTVYDSYLGRMDTLAVQIGITRLSLKYNLKYSQTTIDEFDKVKNEQIKKEYAWVRNLHNVYKSSIDELKIIINEIQNNPIRNNTTNMIRERFIEESTNKITQSTYYNKYYNKEQSIIYLDNQIDLSIELLRQHLKGSFADFSNILKGLTYNK
jgi:hypothetical protein